MVFYDPLEMEFQVAQIGIAGQKEKPTPTISAATPRSRNSDSSSSFACKSWICVLSIFYTASLWNLNCSLYLHKIIVFSFFDY